MNDWMRDEKVKEILLDKKTIDRKIFNKNKSKTILGKNFKNDLILPEKNMMILNLELWMRSNLNKGKTAVILVAAWGLD